MTFSWKRINAIFVKDYKDFSRNLAVSTVLFLPPVLAAIYGRMGVEALESHFMLINLTFAMVAAFVQSCLIAEEKEKDTLRGLILSPASTAEILAGKSLLTFVLTIFTVLLSIFLAGYSPANVPIITAAIILSSFFYIGLGTMLGLYAKSVMEASVFVLPVMIVFSFGSYLTALADQYPLLKAADYLPNVQLFIIGTKLEAGVGFSDIAIHMAIIAVWVITALTAAALMYRKRMVD